MRTQPGLWVKMITLPEGSHQLRECERCSTTRIGISAPPRGGVLTISSQDIVDSSCDAGGGEETNLSSSAVEDGRHPVSIQIFALYNR